VLGRLSNRSPTYSLGAKTSLAIWSPSSIFQPFNLPLHLPTVPSLHRSIVLPFCNAATRSSLTSRDHTHTSRPLLPSHQTENPILPDSELDPLAFCRLLNTKPMCRVCILGTRFAGSRPLASGPIRSSRHPEFPQGSGIDGLQPLAPTIGNHKARERSHM